VRCDVSRSAAHRTLVFEEGRVTPFRPSFRVALTAHSTPATTPRAGVRAGAGTVVMRARPAQASSGPLGMSVGPIVRNARSSARSPTFLTACPSLTAWLCLTLPCRLRRSKVARSSTSSSFAPYSAATGRHGDCVVEPRGGGTARVEKERWRAVLGEPDASGSADTCALACTQTENPERWRRQGRSACIKASSRVYGMYRPARTS
jgi:hypothetical protein